MTELRDRAAFHAAIRTFYAMMGWDEEGTPTPATMYDAGLDWVFAMQGD